LAASVRGIRHAAIGMQIEVSFHMKKKLFLLLLITGAVNATVFKIPKGAHYSLPKVVKPFVGNSMDMTILFDKSTKYELAPEFSSDQGDLNKVYGFSDCGSHHSRNSARFSWRWFENRLEVFAFTHKDGNFSYAFLSEVEVDRPYKASIELSKDRMRYIYTFNGMKVEMERGCVTDKSIGYHLLPYFGGQQVAPNDIYLTVKLGESFGPMIVQSLYPNPIVDKRFKMKVSTYDDVHFHFIMYDTLGRVVYKSSKTRVQTGEDQVLSFEVQRQLSAGAYLIVPIVTGADGVELRANIKSTIADKAIKVIWAN
jgi:hypothetical protein